MGIKELSVGRKDEFVLPLSVLCISPKENVRQDYGDLDQLAKDLSENGQKIPLTVRVDGAHAYISDGCRRFKAVEIANKKYGANIKSLRCVNEDKGTDEKARLFNQLSLNNGKPFEPIEQGIAFQRLVNLGVSIKDISLKIGRTTQTIRNYLELANAPEPVRELVRDKKMKPTTARKMAKATPLKRETARLKAELGTPVKGKDLDEEKPFSAAAFTKGLEQFGFKKASDVTEPGVFNIQIRIDQKDPPFTGLWCL
jgi:ParB/RepB/Spo0J family partition protein